MKQIILLVLVVMGIVLAGCSGHCITIDGTYKEWGGGFTWCIDSQQSSVADRPVLTNSTQQSATLINEAEAIAITEKLSQATGKVSISSVSNFAEFNKFLREIMEKTDGNSH